MKKINTLILALMMTAPAALAQTTYLEQVRLDNVDIDKQGRQVNVSMDVNMDRLDMKTQHRLRLTPVITSADRSQQVELDSFVVTGRTRNKAIERQILLGDITDDGTTRIRRKNGKQQTYHYQTQVAYEPWMLNGHLEMRGYTTGCVNCPEGDETIYAGGILPYTAPTLRLSPVMTPQAETVKHRAESRSARLQYRQDSHTVVPGYKDNRAELATVQQSIDAVKDNRDLVITGIYVTGWASPEAPAAYNLRLSQRRAQGFVAYVKKQNPELDADLWHVDWKGEDWDGLRREVEQAARLDKKSQVLDIIDRRGNQLDAAEDKIKALSMDVYNRLLNELYPSLRRNDYRIEYTVKNYSLEEAKQLLGTRPDLLSVAEIQRVADSYGQGTAQYREALAVACETYPDNVAARNNLALSQIQAGQYAEAIASLQGHDDPALLNLLGVAYYHQGNKQQAVEVLRQAVQAGDKQAADNLRMVQESMLYD